jgi:hypothetical protein
MKWHNGIALIAYSLDDVRTFLKLECPVLDLLCDLRLRGDKLLTSIGILRHKLRRVPYVSRHVFQDHRTDRLPYEAKMVILLLNIIADAQVEEQSPCPSRYFRSPSLSAPGSMSDAACSRP